MLKCYTFFLSLFLIITCFVLNVNSQIITDDPRTTVVIPNTYSGTAGTATFTGPLATAQRTYQFLINANQLTSLVGTNIISLSMRIPTSATGDWPTADVTFTNYDIYLSESRTPSQRSLTFDSNIIGSKTQVRSGSLLITTGSYTFGSTPNAFGTPITFTTPYPYAGGHLLIEIRHSGFSGTSRTNDAIGTAIAGYGTDFSACWTGNYTGSTGAQGNFCVIQLNNALVPVELSSFTASIIKNNVSLHWTTEMETNNSGFDIERKSIAANQQTDWIKIANVQGHGNSNTQKNYSYYDNGLQTGKYSYRLKQTDFNGNFEYFTLSNEVEIGTPNEFKLSQNYPNPFNPSTKIDYDIPFESKVTLKIYNMLGREVAALVTDNLQKAGFYSVNFNAASITSGTYFYTISAQSSEKNFTMTKKMMLIK